MAYDDRPEELFDALEGVAGDAKERAHTRSVITEYLRQRQNYLDTFFDLLDPTPPEPCHRAWLTETKIAMALPSVALGGSNAGETFLSRVAEEEQAFFFNLHFSQLPVQRDRMIGQLESLRRAMRAFANAWEKRRSSDNQIDGKMRRRAGEYRELVRTAASCAASAEGGTDERVHETVELIMMLGQGGSDMNRIGMMVNGEVRNLKIFQLLSREEQVIVTFAGAQEMVSAFLLSNGYPTLKVSLDDGEAAADALPTKMLTPGQRADARAFAERAKDRLAAIMSVAESEYKNFVRRHEYLFFGPAGAGYAREIMADDVWRDRARRWRDHHEDFDDVLRECTLSAAPDRIVEISPDGIDDAERDRILDVLRGSYRKLMSAWKALKESSTDPEWIIESHRDEPNGVSGTAR